MRGSFGGTFGMGRSGAAGGGGGGGGGGGSSGGGSGGGAMLRAARRVARSGLDHLPSSSRTTSPTRTTTTTTTTTTKTRSSAQEKSTASSQHALSLNTYTSVNPAWPPLPYYFGGGGEGYEVFDQWECVEDYFVHDVDDVGSKSSHVFGDVPSPHEVQNALLSLQQVIRPVSPTQLTKGEIHSDSDKESTDTMQRASSTGSVDWIEPSMQIYDQRFSRSSGWERVYDAFHLLQTEPSVQRMVLSLSSDKAVWDAVLKNEAVREIRESYRNAAETDHGNSNEKSDLSNANSSVLKWIFDNTKVKFQEILATITKIMGELFNPDYPVEHDKTEKTDLAFTEKLKSTFLLTVVVLLIVVVARVNKS